MSISFKVVDLPKEKKISVWEQFFEQLKKLPAGKAMEVSDGEKLIEHVRAKLFGAAKQYKTKIATSAKTGKLLVWQANGNGTKKYRIPAHD